MLLFWNSGSVTALPTPPYTYNGNGQKLTLAASRGYLAEMKYDAFGRQSRWVFPAKSTPGVADQGDYEQYGYDPNGNRSP